MSSLPFKKADCAVYCSVVPRLNSPLEKIFKKTALPFVRLTEKNFPLPICYDTPRTLGHDRLALCLGALALKKKKAIVVDAGTAVTVDGVDMRKGFLGGFIAPGLGLMLESLHTRTAQLPRVKPAGIVHPQLPGKTTAQAIGRGAALSFRGGVGEMVCSLQKIMGKNTPVIVTGRGAEFLGKRPVHTRDGDLLLKGLAFFARQQSFQNR